jgi:hypothetical protein
VLEAAQHLHLGTEHGLQGPPLIPRGGLEGSLLAEDPDLSGEHRIRHCHKCRPCPTCFSTLTATLPTSAMRPRYTSPKPP